MKKRLLKYAGERWRGFKADLGRYYIFGPKSKKNPLEVYPFLDKATWDRFVQSRRDPSFQVNLFDLSLNLCNCINFIYLCNLIVFYL